MIKSNPILESLLGDDRISEIMINGAGQVYVEREGKLSLSDKVFNNNNEVINLANELLKSSSKYVDENSPFADAMLADGSRINVILPPVSLTGPMLTIRKFLLNKIAPEDLVTQKSLSPKMLDFLSLCVKTRKNIIVSGGSGTGKTTLLNTLSKFIGNLERIITIEDTAELSLTQAHVGRLESKPQDINGKGGITTRQLLINALRMRPDRIIGECRSSESLDMLQAMNTGHSGSMATIHSNSSRDCLRRLETMVMMSGFDIPSLAIREQIASSVNIIIQLARFADGTRKIVEICEVGGMEGNVIILAPIYRYRQAGLDPNTGEVMGCFEPTGTVPSFIEVERHKGNKIDMSLFQPAR